MDERPAGLSTPLSVRTQRQLPSAENRTPSRLLSRTITAKTFANSPAREKQEFVDKSSRVMIQDECDREFTEIYQLTRMLDPHDVAKERLSRYEQCCRRHAKTVAETIPERAKIYTQEANTWNLLQRLFLKKSEQKRLNPDLIIQDEDGFAMYEGVPPQDEPARLFDSDSLLVSKIRKNPNLSEVIVVKEWLEQTAPEFAPAEVMMDPHAFTRSHIRTRKPLESARSAGLGLGRNFAGGDKDDQIVSELDPDACLRQRKHLTSEDQSYEAAFMRTLFEYIRRGKMSHAMQLCTSNNQFWRAASITGGLAYREDAFIDGTADHDSQEFGGCENRALWKSVCYQIAIDEAVNPYERAVYAVLAGDVDNAAPVCSTWEDHAWIRFSALAETMVLKSLLECTNPFPHYGELSSPVPQYDVSLTTIFTNILSIDNEAIKKQSREAYYVFQAHIICGSFDRLLSDFAHYLKALCNDPNNYSKEFVLQTLRFCTHLSLFLYNVDAIVYNNNFECILTDYIMRLYISNDSDLIPIYVNSLPSETQINTYSAFLMLDTMRNVDFDRRVVVDVGREFGLDMLSICLKAVDLVFEETGVVEPVLDVKAICASGGKHVPVPAVDICNITDNISKEDETLIRAMHWLLLEDVPLHYFYQYVNLLLRWMLLQGRVQSAAAVFNEFGEYPRKLPEKDEQTSELAFNYEEYAHMKLMIDCFQTRLKWYQLLMVERPEADSRQMPRWLMQLKALTETHLLELEHLTQNATLFAFMSALESSQMEFQTRRYELKTLRVIYLPEFVMWRHHTLFETRHFFPGHLEKSLNLATDVAKTCFVEMRRSRRLREFLVAMNSSAVELLGHGKTLLSRSDASV